MRNRNSKVMALTALVIGAVALTIGFAAFSTTLNIRSGAKISADSTNFKIVPQYMTCSKKSGDSSVSATATIGGSSGNYTIDIVGNFVAPGDSVVCTGSLKNEGMYPAYLKSISGLSGPTCEATGSNYQNVSNVDAACAGITMTLEINGTTMYNRTNITSHLLSASSSDSIALTITYATGAQSATGPFTVEFTPINLTYKSTD